MLPQANLASIGWNVPFEYALRKSCQLYQWHELRGSWPGSWYRLRQGGRFSAFSQESTMLPQAKPAFGSGTKPELAAPR